MLLLLCIILFVVILLLLLLLVLLLLVLLLLLAAAVVSMAKSSFPCRTQPRVVPSIRPTHSEARITCARSPISHVMHLNARTAFCPNS